MANIRPEVVDLLSRLDRATVFDEGGKDGHVLIRRIEEWRQADGSALDADQRLLLESATPAEMAAGYDAARRKAGYRPDRDAPSG